MRHLGSFNTCKCDIVLEFGDDDELELNRQAEFLQKYSFLQTIAPEFLNRDDDKSFEKILQFLRTLRNK